MFSAIFVDRPRLAIVIALVTTIAGLLSLFIIPLAQYPNIVPPQVQVTTMYPGANSGVVDATVAQPIEAQVVGVDKMIYMKSVSGDDGSYTLLCSFELGTDPDINAVNVNNRVQIALPSLPPDVQKQGVTVKKKSSALLETERQPYQAHFNMDRSPRPQLALYSVSIAGPFDQSGVEDTPSRQRIFVCRPAKASDEDACAKTILSTLARRAYRRPVSDADLQAPLGFYKNGRTEGGFEAGIETAI